MATDFLTREKIARIWSGRLGRYVVVRIRWEQLDRQDSGGLLRLLSSEAFEDDGY